MKLFTTLLLAFSSSTLVQAQSDTAIAKRTPNIMRLEITGGWVNQPTYRNGRFEKNTPTFTSGRSIYINDNYMGGVGRRYKNLKPYFKNCDAAMKKYNKAMTHMKIYKISMYSTIAFGVGGLIKTANPKDDNDKTGIVILSAGAAFLINTLVQDGLEKLSIKKAVKAYNKCETQKL
jgi:hypothetical protein